MEIQEVSSSRIVARYDYVDENGALLYQVLRREPKGFTQRRPDGRGGWVNNLHDVRRVLYNLPNVLKASVVWIAEGEKDCDLLNSLGQTATTNAGGANNWEPSFANYLRGKMVLIIADNDEPGRAHGEMIANRLCNVAASVRLLDWARLWKDCPPKGDISDYYEYRNVDKKLFFLTLKAWALDAPKWEYKLEFVDVPAKRGAEPADESLKSELSTMSAPDLMSREFTQLFQPVEGFICEGLTFLVGASKIGKSWLVLLLAAQVAAGKTFLNRQTTQCRVLYLALEDSDRRLQSRLKLMNIEIPKNLSLATVSKRMDEGFEQQVEAWLQKEEGQAMIIIDTFQKVRGMSPKGVNCYQHDYEAVGKLKQIADKHRAAIVCIHHTNKLRNVDDPYEKVSGSTGIMGSADTTILITRERSSENATVMYTGRDVYGKNFIIKFVDGRWDILDEDAETFKLKQNYDKEPLVQLFRKLIAENPNGGRWTYNNLKTIGLELLGFQPFTDGKDITRALSAGLSDELRQRDNLIVECGVPVLHGRGIKLMEYKPLLNFQSKMALFSQASSVASVSSDIVKVGCDALGAPSTSGVSYQANVKKCK